MYYNLQLLFSYKLKTYIIYFKGVEYMDEAILSELRMMNTKLGSIEKVLKTTQKDVSDIKKYLRVGIEEDLS